MNKIWRIVLSGVGVIVIGSLIYVYIKQKRKKENCIRKIENKKENVVCKHVPSNDVNIDQVYAKMNERNELANQVLNEIHNDMKESKQNITKEKKNIEELMRELKKDVGDN